NPHSRRRAPRSKHGGRSPETDPDPRTYSIGKRVCLVGGADKRPRLSVGPRRITDKRERLSEAIHCSPRRGRPPAARAPAPGTRTFRAPPQPCPPLRPNPLIFCGFGRGGMVTGSSLSAPIPGAVAPGYGRSPPPGAARYLGSWGATGGRDFT